MIVYSATVPVEKTGLRYFNFVLVKSELLCIVIIILAVSLTISTIDTIVNAISSLILVDGSKFSNIDLKMILLNPF